jgi:hydroxyacylglutathione hydrolase
MHPLQKQFYDTVVIEAAQVFGLPAFEFKEDGIFEGSVLTLGDIELDMIPAPGHSPDCVCFYYRSGKALVCGDVLFAQDTGRVDLPGGDAAALKKSIGKLSKLEIDYLLPGHMHIVAGADNVKRNFDFIKGYVFQWL